MNQTPESERSEAFENLKILGAIVAAAGLGVLLAHGSAGLFGYKVTLVAMMVVLFIGLALDSTVIDALIPTIIFGVLGFVALNSFPRLIPVVGGGLSGIALSMAFAAYKDERNSRRANHLGQ